MRTELTMAIVLLMLTPPAAATAELAQATPAAAGQAAKTGGPPVGSLAGTWRSKSDPLKLTSDFDRSVWGENASSVRNTELVVQSSGEATLTVTRQVVDGKGRPVPASTSIEEVAITIGAASPGPATRMEHAVKIVRAERRYPDDPPSTWPLEGVAVRVVTFTDSSDTLEVRFDTPEGRGSFWELLHRSGRASSSRASK